MKALFTCLFLGLLALPVRADLPPQVTYTTPKLVVVFLHPGKYRDIRDQYSPTDKGELYILSQLKDALVADADHDVPVGCQLTLTFTDIKLAGDFEPWRGPMWDAVRIVKDIYYPYFRFNWKLAGPSGDILKQGSENLQDMDFQMRPVLDLSDPLRYEKDMLREWMGDHMPRT